VTAGLPTPSGDGKQDYSVRLVRFLRSAKFKAVHVSRFEDDDVGEEFDEFEMVSIGKGADSLPPALGSTVHVTGPKGEEGVVRVSSYELDEDGTSACLLLKGSDMDLLFFCEPGTEIALEVRTSVIGQALAQNYGLMGELFWVEGFRVWGVGSPIHCPGSKLRVTQVNTDGCRCRYWSCHRSNAESS
jgi:hypothetical protein